MVHDIEYVFGAQSDIENTLCIAVKLRDEVSVRLTIVKNGMDFHGRVSKKEAKDMCFDFVHKQKWTWLTADDIEDVVGIRKQPLHGHGFGSDIKKWGVLCAMLIAVPLIWRMRRLTASYKG
jgi:hypothetical protein